MIDELTVLVSFLGRMWFWIILFAVWIVVTVFLTRREQADDVRALVQWEERNGI